MVANTFREMRKLFAGRRVDECIIFRDPGSTDPPGGPLLLQIPAPLPLTFMLGSSLHKLLSSTLYITSPMHLLSLKLLCQTVKG